MPTPSRELSDITSIPKIDKIKRLLSACDLPVADIASSSPISFFGIRHESDLVAVVGIACLGTVGLLRSLAVLPSYRGLGLAQKLVVHTERFAISKKIAALYLLTTTAAAFFQKMGYAPLSRENVPPAIQSSTQFSGICPASSVLLYKSLADI